ncbi:MAG: hypothetical protein DRI56_00300 [Chloroflexota bacterium]|nr:MAG: hypothetical protein DRI56_00300 [Chloroflexota bacterium]
MKKRTSFVILWMIGLLLIASLACNQSGDILTPEKATQRVQAVEDAIPTVVAIEEEDLEGPQPGDEIYLTAHSYLVNIVDEPGSLKIIANQQRGIKAIILQVTLHEGELWYYVDAPAGKGWVKEENISTEAP